jgi:hypothetical protein
VIRGRGDRGSPYGWSYRLADFFSGILLGKRTADPEHSSLTYYKSTDAFLTEDVPLGVLIHLIPCGSYSPKTPHIGDFNGDFQLIRLLAYLNTEETYHNAWWLKMRIWARHTMFDRKKLWMGSFQEVKFTLFPKNSIQRGCPAKTTCWMTFKLFDPFSLAVYQSIQLDK